MTYGLIGKSLSHSYSKIIHEYLSDKIYDLLPLTQEDMEEYVMSRCFKGLNITTPYKERVVALCDELTPLAGEIGAVNTLFFAGSDDSKRLVGDNTDYYGLLAASKIANIHFTHKNVLILGTGGTSKTAAALSAHEGAANIFKASRYPGVGGDNWDRFSYASLPTTETQIIINTTPVGMFPHNDTTLIDLKKFPYCEGVVDVIYNPIKTRLVLQAESMGIPCSGGLPMLVGQAVRCARIFGPEYSTTAAGDIEKVFEDLLEKLERRLKNIVIIGMPGVGKTTFAKALRHHCNRQLISTDDIIFKRFGQSAGALLSKWGEERFRAVETDAIRSASRGSHCIIDTGGGAVLSDYNVKELKQNGTLIFLNRPVEAFATSNRPLSDTLEKQRELLKKRQPIYRGCCDVELDVPDPKAISHLL